MAGPTAIAPSALAAHPSIHLLSPWHLRGSSSEAGSATFFVFLILLLHGIAKVCTCRRSVAYRASIRLQDMVKDDRVSLWESAGVQDQAQTHGLSASTYEELEGYEFLLNEEVK
jgi:hypothetical protein